MQRFVEKPHLPQGRVTQLILGEKYRNVIGKALFDLNIEPIWLNNNSYVDERLSGHCDIMAAHLGNNILAVQEEAIDDCYKINNIEMLPVTNPQLSEYPHDAALNFCVLGDKLICNPKTADMDAALYYKRKLITCKQGYTKCSICVVDEDSIITADKKIAAAAADDGISVLLVKDNLASLDGFDHGFIGGAAFKVSKSEIAFTGMIDDYNERIRIESFLEERDVKAVYLTERQLFDIGSAIPITEKIT